MSEITLALIYITVVVAAVTVELTHFKRVAITLTLYGILTTLLTILEGEIIGSILNLIVVGIVIPLLIIKVAQKIDFKEKEKYFSTATVVIALVFAVGLVTVLLFAVPVVDWKLSIALALAGVGTYALILKGNLIKMAIGYTIYDSALHVFFSLYALQYEAPELLMILALTVIDGLLLGIVVTILYLAINTYQKTGTIDSWSLRRLRW
ncbi:MAG: NADH-quinone oxidoreductase subunit K [Candidatus Asgardarchaeum sp.]